MMPFAFAICALVGTAANYAVTAKARGKRLSGPRWLHWEPQCELLMARKSLVFRRIAWVRMPLRVSVPAVPTLQSLKQNRMAEIRFCDCYVIAGPKRRKGALV
jgi:hypothetical protein